VEALRTGEPVLALHARPEEDAVGAELAVAVPDQPGVLPAVAGVLALHRLTVRAADLRSLELPGRLGEALVLRWRVAAGYGSLPEGARLRADLVRALEGGLDVSAKLAEREAAYPRRRGVVPPPPRVTVVPGVSSLATVLEVRAPDAVGLLHRIGRALEDAGVRVRSAHVSTLGANAVDSLYVTSDEGKPLAPAEAAAVAEGLARALA
jgi:[protein-PII] uridylyltransferase